MVKDLDGDSIMDTVRIEYFVHPRYISENMIISDNFHICDTISENYSYIVCLLSSRQFEKMYSRKMMNDFGGNNGTDYYITPTRSGFEYFEQYTRNGIKAQFRYDKQTEKIQLIGMSCYDNGLFADKCDKGKSSVNLLTGDYIGDWLLYEFNLDKMVKIPIKTKMDFKTIYLEDFSDDILSDFYIKSDELRYEQKRKIIETNIEKMTRNK